MGLGDLLRKIFSPADATPPDVPRLSGASESALASSLRSLPAGEKSESAQRCDKVKGCIITAYGT